MSKGWGKSPLASFLDLCLHKYYYEIDINVDPIIDHFDKKNNAKRCLDVDIKNVVNYIKFIL